MAKLFNNIFKKKIQIPASQIKNSFEFENIITKITVPHDHLMIFLDVAIVIVKTKLSIFG